MESFLALLAAQPDRVSAAVSQAGSAAETLRQLGYANEASRREQLRDAVMYWAWDTAHWDHPVPAGVALRDFSDAELAQINTYGSTFERRVNEHVRAGLTSFGEEVEAEPGVYSFNAYTYYDERALTYLPLPPSPPWDAVLVDYTRRRVWAFEVKVGVKHARTAWRQIRARREWLDSVQEEAWTAQPVCVVSSAADTVRAAGVIAAMRRNNVWVGSLAELDLAALLA